MDRRDVPRPSAGSRSVPVASTDDAMEHLLGADPVMGKLVEEQGRLDEEERTRGRPADAYGALVRSIVGQQLSTKAARTIYERLTGLYDGTTPTPEQLIDTDPDDLRGVGSLAREGVVPALAGRARGVRASWSSTASPSCPTTR